MKLLQINGGLSFTFVKLSIVQKTTNKNISKGMNFFTFYSLT